MGGLISLYFRSQDYSNIEKKTVQQNFNPFSYSGEWYEIARYDLFWEDKCDRAKAIYSYNNEKGLIYVTNICLDSNGKEIERRTGEAKIVDPEKHEGKLALRFTDGGISQPGDAPYWVHWTDYTNYAIVGGPSNAFLWILARKSQIPNTDIPMLLEKVRNLGYNENGLKTNPEAILMISQ